MYGWSTLTDWWVVSCRHAAGKNSGQKASRSLNSNFPASHPLPIPDLGWTDGELCRNDTWECGMEARGMCRHDTQEQNGCWRPRHASAPLLGLPLPLHPRAGVELCGAVSQRHAGSEDIGQKAGCSVGFPDPNPPAAFTWAAMEVQRHVSSRHVGGWERG